MTVETAQNRIDTEIPVGAKLLFTTSKGSVYYQLPDGKTQRFKLAEKSWQTPQDLIVFVPDYNTIKQLKPSDLSDAEFETIYGENLTQLTQILLEAIYSKTHYFSIVNEHGAITSNAEKEASERLFAVFQLKSNPKIRIVIPVSKTPKMGYTPLDSRYYVNNDVAMHEKHLGNRITQIAP